MSAPDFELSPVEAPFQIAADAEPQSSGDPSGRDGGILIPPAAGADEPWTYVSIPPGLHEAEAELVSAILNLPPVGPVKGLVEAYTGEDLITGRHLEWWERSLNVLVLVPVPEAEAVEEGAQILRALEAIHTVIEAVHTIHHVHELGEAADHVKSIPIPDPQPATHP